MNHLHYLDADLDADAQTPQLPSLSARIAKGKGMSEGI